MGSPAKRVQSQAAQGSNPCLSAGPSVGRECVGAGGSHKAQWVSGLAVSLQNCLTPVRIRSAPLVVSRKGGTLRRTALWVQSHCHSLLSEVPGENPGAVVNA
jgi:hypothetical protein